MLRAWIVCPNLTSSVVCCLYSKRYLEALASVPNKVVYANVVGDLMVPHWSAALVPSPELLACLARHTPHVAQVTDAAMVGDEYPYIAAMYEQRTEGDDIAALFHPRPECTASQEPHVLQCANVDAGDADVDEADLAGGECLAELSPHNALEAAITSRLRSVRGGWTTVDVDMSPMWMASAHSQITGNFLRTARSCVPTHVASLFVVTPEA